MLLQQCQQGIIAHAAQRGTCTNVMAQTNPSTSEINSQHGMLLDNELQQEWFLSPATGSSISGNSACSAGRKVCTRAVWDLQEALAVATAYANPAMLADC